MKNKQSIRNIAITLVCFISVFILHIISGKHIIFDDFYNYHLCNAWEFLNHRIAYDILPVGIQSYFNPILDIINFLLWKTFNNYPRIILFIYAIPTTLLLFLSFKISENVLSDKMPFKIFVCSLICFVFLQDNTLLILTGSFTNDIITAVITMSAYLVCLKSIKKNGCITPKSLNIIMFISGLAIGLKLTALVLVIGLFVASYFFVKNKKNILFSLPYFLLGYLPIAGVWNLYIFLKFGNPVFPYFNNIFHSSLANSVSFFYEDFYFLRPQKILDLIYFKPLFEKNFTNIFIFLGGFCGILSTFINVIRNKIGDYFERNTLFFIATSSLVSYFSGILIFGDKRYFIPLKFMFCILFIYFIYVIFRHFRIENKLYQAVIAIAIIISSFFKMYYGFPIETKEKFFTVYKNAVIPKNSTVILTYNTGYIMLFQDKTLQYIHLGNIRFKEDSFQEFYNLDLYSTDGKEYIKKLIDKNKNNIYISISIMKNPDVIKSILRKQGIMVKSFTPIGIVDASPECISQFDAIIYKVVF
ncbi:MAG: hypothetical protein PHV37_07725 [Candidatus Gastranaerophilales bacterium]|nr:hypothetical protein [Candidatus Gastranaerophilales bacterium]